MPTPAFWIDEAARLRRLLEEVDKIDGARVEGNRIYIGGNEEDEDERDDSGS